MQGFKILAALCALVSLVAADGGRIKLPKPQQKNVCQNKEDGVFLPVAGSCSKYIICSGGSAVEQDCGGYHFSAKYSACDLPERVGCVVTESLLPQTPPSKSVCSGKMDGTKLSVPGSDSKYHLCKNEKATLNDCGSLKFDKLSKQCVTDKQVVVPNPKLPPCYAVANGISIPVPGNSRQYYFCMNNKAYLKDCGNMYFAAKYSACVVSPDSPAPVVTSKPQIVSPTKIPSNQHETESSACNGQPDGVSLPIYGNPQKYNFCMNNKAFLKDCGNRMVFVAKYSACAPSSSIQPVEELDLTSNEALIRHVCKNQKFGARVALPGHCSWYAICTVNTGFLKTCGWREFNSKTASCDLPQNVLCKAYEETPEQPDYQPTPKPPTSTLADRICVNQNDGTFVAAPGSCSEFFFCLKKQGYRKSCGRNRHFNPTNMICVDEKDSKCVDVLYKKSQRAVDPRDDTSCVNRESGTLLRSPTGCGQFIICDNHIAREMDCPDGLHFNVEDNVCDWPTNAKCA